MKKFWDDHRFGIMITVILGIALVLTVTVGIPYFHECLDRGGFMFGGKSSLCMTPDGILWPWEI